MTLLEKFQKFADEHNGAAEFPSAYSGGPLIEKIRQEGDYVLYEYDGLVACALYEQADGTICDWGDIDPRDFPNLAGATRCSYHPNWQSFCIDFLKGGAI